MAPVAPISALMQNAQDMLGRQQQEEATLRAASFAASSALQEAQVSPNWLSSSLMCHFVAHISLMILQQPVRNVLHHRSNQEGTCRSGTSLTSYMSISWSHHLTNQVS